MTESEKIVRAAYETAERRDVDGFIDCFTPDGTLTDQSIGVTFGVVIWRRRSRFMPRPSPICIANCFASSRSATRSSWSSHCEALTRVRSTFRLERWNRPERELTRLAAMSFRSGTARSSRSTAIRPAPLSWRNSDFVEVDAGPRNRAA